MLSTQLYDLLIPYISVTCIDKIFSLKNSLLIHDLIVYRYSTSFHKVCKEFTLFPFVKSNVLSEELRYNIILFCLTHFHDIDLSLTDVDAVFAYGNREITKCKILNNCICTTNDNLIWHSVLTYAIRRDDSKITKLLISYGCDVNHVTVVGVHTLVYAIANNNSVEIVRLLIKAGADVNYINTYKSDTNDKPFTALLYAMKFIGHNQYNTKLIIDALIEAGACVTTCEDTSTHY